MRKWLVVWFFALSSVMAAEDVEAPSVELLEFLGSWETEQGWKEAVLAAEMSESIPELEQSSYEERTNEVP